MKSGETSHPISEFRTLRRVELADTDMGGIVHFSRFFVFMETAEHQLLRELGAEPMPLVGNRLYGWPRVSAQCDYLSPARLDDELAILVRVARKGRSSLTCDFLFSCRERSIARGRMTSVYCRMDGAEGTRAEAMPREVADLLEVFEEAG